MRKIKRDWYLDFNDPQTIKAFENLFDAIQKDTTEDFLEFEEYEKRKKSFKLLINPNFKL